MSAKQWKWPLAIDPSLAIYAVAMELIDRRSRRDISPGVADQAVHVGEDLLVEAALGCMGAYRLQAIGAYVDAHSLLRETAASSTSPSLALTAPHAAPDDAVADLHDALAASGCVPLSSAGSAGCRNCGDGRISYGSAGMTCSRGCPMPLMASALIQYAPGVRSREAFERFFSFFGFGDEAKAVAS